MSTTQPPRSLMILPSAARTTTQTGNDIVNVEGYRGVQLIVDTTAFGSGSVTVTIQGKDPVSGKYYTILAGAAIVSVVTNVYTVYPGMTAAANVSTGSPLPAVWRVLATANNGNTQTYSIGANMIP